MYCFVLLKHSRLKNKSFQTVKLNGGQFYLCRARWFNTAKSLNYVTPYEVLQFAVNVTAPLMTSFSCCV